MSKLQLSNQIKFEPLIKLTKKQILLVENDWHHATLTYGGLIPSHDFRYNDYDYEDHEILDIILKYGVRTPRWMSFNNNLTDDEYYQFALDNIHNKDYNMRNYILY